ncbi:MAG TPA: hypothetical protein VIL36_03980 [Acidimicrobiales bacterium]
MRRGLAAALLALLAIGSAACGEGGGEAERAPDSREAESDDADDDSRGAPGEDPGGNEDDEEGGAPGQDPGDGDGDGDNDAAAATAAGVEAAYVAFQEMVERLVITPDPDDPEIAERATGAAHDEVVATLDGFDRNGQAVEFGTRHEHHVYDVQVDGDTATVLDCLVSDRRVVDESSRRIVRSDPEGGAAQVLTATLVREDGDWKVQRVTSMPVEPPQGCGPDGVIHTGS